MSPISKEFWHELSEFQRTRKEVKPLITQYEVYIPWQLPLRAQQPCEQFLTVKSWIIKSTGVRRVSYCIRIGIRSQKKTYAGVRKEVNRAWLNYLHVIPHNDLRDWPHHLKFENLTSIAIMEHTLMNVNPIDASNSTSDRNVAKDRRATDLDAALTPALDGANTPSYELTVHDNASQNELVVSGMTPQDQAKTDQLY